MTILEELIAPLSLGEFHQNYLFQRPFAAPFTAARFRNLISWPLLEAILANQGTDCWLPKQGQLPTDPTLSTGHLTFEQARRGFQEGRTILIRHAETTHPSLNAIAEDFHNLFLDPVDIQIYCTPENEEGFNWHYDFEEVFVIQSFGEKEFRLRRNTINPWPLSAKLPKDLKFEFEQRSPEIRCLLQAGDWLYIPSGYWHKARALTPSFHLSVGVTSLTGIDYLAALLPKLEDNFLWRQRLPLRGSPELALQQDHKLRCQEMLRKLNESITGLLADESQFNTFVRTTGRK